MLLLLLAACGHELVPDETVTDRCTTDKLGDGSEFFDPSVLHQVRITLAEPGVNDLRDDPREYTAADVEIDGTPLANVGVRLKGSSSFQEFDEKPAFKVKLNEYCEGQKYAGLKRLTLNNMVSDPSQSQELINYPLWDAAGLKAPRVSYAQVYVNDEPFGLYANVESMDGEWIEHRYADDSGDLWEAQNGAEFSAEGLTEWELKEGDGDTAALEAVVAALDAPGSVYTNLDAVIVEDQFLAYWAWKVIVGDPDGYPWHPNDVFLYGDPMQGGRFEFSPWGFDEAWRDYVDWNDAEARLATVCLAEADCEARFLARLDTELTTFESLDPLAWAEAAWALSEPVLADDPRRPYSIEEVHAAREELRDIIRGRAAEVREEL